MAGRPRKTGGRYPNGRLKRRIRAAEIKENNMRARCRLFGWKPSNSNLRRADNPICGSELGRLSVRGYGPITLSPRHVQAGLELAKLRSRYRALTGLPYGGSRDSIDFSIRGVSGVEPDLEVIENVRNRLANIADECLTVGPSVLAAVIQLVEDDRRPVGLEAVQEALGRIARLMGL